MNILKSLKHKKGFTLIEMLIVVAIIGALVLVFSPSFDVFKKADGVALNARASSIETAALQYYVDNSAYPYSATKTTTADFDANRAKMLTIVKDAMGVSAVSDATKLDTFLTENVVKLDTTNLTKYVKGSSADLGEFYIVKVDTAGTLYSGATAPQKLEMDAINGYILSKKTVVDAKGVVYNGTFRK